MQDKHYKNKLVEGSDNMPKIVLDPGHGAGRAHNRGFVNVPNWPYCNEGDNNFIYARDYLKPALERAGFSVALTRNSISENPSLPTRGAKAKGADLLLSIHTNATNGKATGTEIWDSTNPKESDPKMFGELSGAIAKAIGTNNRGVKYRRSSNGSNYYGILRHGYANKNAIIEHVFHDNYADAKKFIDHLQATANATADVLANKYGLSKKTVPTIPTKDPGQDFIEAVWRDIKNTKLRILPSVTIAQAILESAWGQSELAKNAKNLFGIKAGKDWNGAIYSKITSEQDKQGNSYNIQADFRKYNSYLESVQDHDNFFVSTDWRKSNYKAVLEATNYKDQANALQTCGYATDTKYASKLISIIERNSLQTFDKGVQAVEQVKNTQEPASWAKEAWDWGKANGITDGTDPQRPATRQEIVTMLKRAKEVENEQHDSTNSNGTRYSTGL